MYCCIFTACHLIIMVMIWLKPETFNNNNVLFSYGKSTLLSVMNLGFEFKNLGSISHFRVSLLNGFPNLLCCWEKHTWTMVFTSYFVKGNILGIYVMYYTISLSQTWLFYFQSYTLVSGGRLIEVMHQHWCLEATMSLLGFSNGRFAHLHLAPVYDFSSFLLFPLATFQVICSFVFSPLFF